MSDILDAVSRRSQEGFPEVDVVVLNDARLFPAPAEVQRAEFEKIATRLLELRTADEGYVIAFAANAPGEGASFVSYNLARIFAAFLGRRTLWIDANFLSPNPVLSHRADDTFAAHLVAPAGVELRLPDGRLTIMPGGERLAFLKADMADNTRRVFDALRRQYEFVIVDCPPVLEAVEAAWLGAAADGMVVVVEARRLKSQVINHGLHSLQEQKVNVLGTVLNRRSFDLPKAIYDRL
jgi:succinoglycan biosynthesis transport protein ExoP